MPRPKKETTDGVAFARIAEGRVQKAINAIRSVGAISAPSTAVQRKRINDALITTISQAMLTLEDMRKAFKL